MYLIRLLLFTLFTVALGKADGSEIYIRSPHTAWDGFTITPFLIPPQGSIRYQQVYRASDFAGYGMPAKGGWITEIQFMMDGVWAFELDQIQINMSTTTRFPDSLSSLFAGNVGVDETIVYGPNSLQIINGLITLDEPFFYNHNEGNLLLDVRNYQGPEIWVPDSYGMAYSESQTVGGITVDDVHATTAEYGGTGGLITLFTITPIPEPSSSMLLATGFSLLALLTWWRRHMTNSRFRKGGFR